MWLYAFIYGRQICLFIPVVVVLAYANVTNKTDHEPRHSVSEYGFRQCWVPSLAVTSAHKRSLHLRIVATPFNRMVDQDLINLFQVSVR